MQQPVLSHFQVGSILRTAREGKGEIEVSLDLGLTTSRVSIELGQVALPDGQRLSWDILERIAKDDVGCYVIEDNTARKLQAFSEALNRHYSLMPTERAPTMLISGLPMHRIKDVDPREDTSRKIKTIAPLRGRVLDTATGLGYTAIMAAETAERVVTIELDETALDVARLNPWSRALFNNPKIEQVIGDAFDEVTRFDDAAFSAIIHDPPTFSLAGELYSEEMYRRLFRVLRSGGRMFHYIGDLDSPSGGRVAKGAARRLQDVGFGRITQRPEAFGLVAHKL